MALEQTLVSPKNLFSVHKNSLTNSQIPSLSSVRLLSYPRQNTKQLSSNRRWKCSLDYNQVANPRPSEIAWKKELCNSVNLIGIVGAPVEVKHLPSGKVVAWTRLAVKKSATATSWINLTFWEELAHVALQHVEKGDQIYVSGRLVSDTVESDDGKQQTYYKVVVQQLNFIERSFASYDRDPNFMTPDRKLGNSSANNTSSTEELWQAFFANPVDWWDNRKTKRSPKYPDFKHKDTGEALWVEGKYNPPWVKSQLAILDTRMGALYDQDARMPLNSMVSDEFMPF